MIGFEKDWYAFLVLRISGRNKRKCKRFKCHTEHKQIYWHLQVELHNDACIKWNYEIIMVFWVDIRDCVDVVEIWFYKSDVNCSVKIVAHHKTAYQLCKRMRLIFDIWKFTKCPVIIMHKYFWNPTAWIKKATTLTWPAFPHKCQSWNHHSN
jgi:hypothetical protein